MSADHYVMDSDMKKVADAIRTKGGTTAPLVFPDGFVQAINAIPTVPPVGPVEPRTWTVADFDEPNAGLFKIKPDLRQFFIIGDSFNFVRNIESAGFRSTDVPGIEIKSIDPFNPTGGIFGTITGGTELTDVMNLSGIPETSFRTADGSNIPIKNP